MATIIIKKNLEFVKKEFLPIFGKIEICSDFDGENILQLSQKNFDYKVSISSKDSNSELKFEVSAVRKKGKEFTMGSGISFDLIDRALDNLWKSMISHCNNKKILYKAFEKFEFLDELKEKVIIDILELINIGIIPKNVLMRIYDVAFEEYRLRYLYEPLISDISVLFCLSDLIDHYCVYEDYYEFFYGLTDNNLKKGYEELIRRMLGIADIRTRRVKITWEGSFDNGNATAIIHYSTEKITLKKDGEKVDIEPLLIGINNIIKKRFPHELRKFCLLQIYNDQSNCVWFVTEEQRKKLCKILHKYWGDYKGDYFCDIEFDNTKHEDAKSLKKS